MFVACAPYLIASMARAENVRADARLGDRDRPGGGRRLRHEAALPRHPRRGRTLPADPPRLAHGSARSHPVVDRPRRRGACRVDVHDLRRLRPLRAAARRRSLRADRRRGLARRAHQQRAGAHPDRAGDLRRDRRGLHQDHLGARARGVRHRRGDLGHRPGQGLALSRAARPVGGDPARRTHRVADRRPLPADQPQRPSPAGGGDLGHPDGAALLPGGALHAALLQAAPVRGFDRRPPAAHHRAERAAPHAPGAVARHLSAMAADQLYRRAHDHALPQHVGAAGRLRDLRRLPGPLQSARHDGRFREVRVRGR